MRSRFRDIEDVDDELTIFDPEAEGDDTEQLIDGEACHRCTYYGDEVVENDNGEWLCPECLGTEDDDCEEDDL